MKTLLKHAAIFLVGLLTIVPFVIIIGVLVIYDLLPIFIFSMLGVALAALVYLLGLLLLDFDDYR